MRIRSDQDSVTPAQRHQWNEEAVFAKSDMIPYLALAIEVQKQAMTDLSLGHRVKQYPKGTRIKERSCAELVSADAHDYLHVRCKSEEDIWMSVIREFGGRPMDKARLVHHVRGNGMTDQDYNRTRKRFKP